MYRIVTLVIFYFLITVKANITPQPEVIQKILNREQICIIIKKKNRIKMKTLTLSSKSFKYKTK